MAANRKLLVLPGDGIGPEVVGQVLRVIDWFGAKRSLSFDLQEGLVGGAAYDAHGTPLTDETLSDALSADAVLFGSVGGPKYDELPFELKPERGLLRLRKEMDLFANLRPAMVFDAMVDSSTLKKEVIEGLDILILRELTGGIYFGEPRGIRKLPDGQREGINTEIYTTNEIVRLGKVGFEIAEQRKKIVHSVEKANVMESGILWREEIMKLHNEKYKHIDLSNMYADNCAMQLVKQPKQFDVIITGNLFGDILSDISAELTGSLGMLPSASLGDEVNGKRKALYEPVHGSAPDIAGKNIANPIAMILSFAMFLKLSLKNNKVSELIESSVENVLGKGYRTKDIMQSGKNLVTTSDMGSLISEEIKNLSRSF